MEFIIIQTARQMPIPPHWLPIRLDIVTDRVLQNRIVPVTASIYIPYWKSRELSDKRHRLLPEKK